MTRVFRAAVTAKDFRNSLMTNMNLKNGHELENIPWFGLSWLLIQRFSNSMAFLDFSWPFQEHSPLSLIFQVRQALTAYSFTYYYWYLLHHCCGLKFGYFQLPPAWRIFDHTILYINVFTAEGSTYSRVQELAFT